MGTGYNLEDWLSDKHTPSRKSAIERREERRASEGEADYKVFNPETLFFFVNTCVRCPRPYLRETCLQAWRRKTSGQISCPIYRAVPYMPKFSSLGTTLIPP